MKKYFFLLLVIIIGAFFILSLNFSKSVSPDYGVSFSRFHSDELGLDWKETYLAILNDLGVKKLRLSAHWQSVEPEKDKYNFRELDFQMNQAKIHKASVILAVGRRLPGWPECHEPDWAGSLSKDEKQDKILSYIEAVVNRYKNYNNILYWQVENEPYLTFFSYQACGALDQSFLDKEIALVKKLDPSKPVLITDSGEFGNWFQAYRKGDIFGTSMYLYVWWRHSIGPIRYPITPGFFRVKKNIISILYGHKRSLVIELSAEPWLLQPITDTPIDTQLQRMGIDKFDEMLDFSSKTGFDTFYLWGAEWWYWMKLHGHSEFWDRAKEIFKQTNSSPDSSLISDPNNWDQIASESLSSSVGIQVFQDNRLVRQGSGLVVSADGLIATAANLMVPRGIYQISYDDDILKGVVAAADYSTNILLLKTSSLYSGVAELAASYSYRADQDIMLTGKSFSLSKTVAILQKGIINYVRGKAVTLSSNLKNYMSGSGVIDSEGKFIGISYLRNDKINLIKADSIENYLKYYINKNNR